MSRPRFEVYSKGLLKQSSNKLNKVIAMFNKFKFCNGTSLNYNECSLQMLRILCNKDGGWILQIWSYFTMKESYKTYSWLTIKKYLD